MGVHWTGIVFGMGGAIACGYWTTDFLVVQRAMAAKDLRAAKMAPLIGAYFKMAVPFIVILPGLAGLGAAALQTCAGKCRQVRGCTATTSCCPSCWRVTVARAAGLGITALIAGLYVGNGGKRQRLRHGLDV